jgi:hypothetical protein
LTHDTYGLARYKDDNYYYSSRFDPAGDEVGAPEPVWPQMSMWVAVYEILSNQQSTALARMQWFVSTSGKGYMPHGEAVSNVTHQSVLSSMSEPLTAASFIITALFYEGQYELRIIPPAYNAGTYMTITINPAIISGDWPQWQNVPYFVASHAASAKSAMTTIKRVYITNDSNNIYIRIDNMADSFSSFANDPKFALHIYSEDFTHGKVEVNSLGLDNNPIHRPMSFLVERRSDEDVFRHWSVSGGIWVSDSLISGVIIPQWESATGRIEATIPIAVLTSAPPMMGNAWANMVLALAYHDPASDTWIDDGKILIHYRLSSSGQSWIYGNIEIAT